MENEKDICRKEESAICIWGKKKRVSIYKEKKRGSTMHSVGLGSVSRISMIFSAPSGGSSVTFLVLGSQTLMGSSS